MNMLFTPENSLQQVVSNWMVYEELNLGETLIFWLQNPTNIDVCIECEIEAVMSSDWEGIYTEDSDRIVFYDYTVDIQSKAKVIDQQDFQESFVNQEFQLTQNQINQLHHMIKNQCDYDYECDCRSHTR